MAKVSGAHQIAFALREHGQDMEAELGAELDVLAQLAARTMRRLAAKWRTTLANSIAVSAPDPMTREIRPGVDYAEAVEDGIKPGKKGLPRFFDPASKSIVDWLESKAFTGQERVRKGTGAFTAREQVLRDRYEGLAWHVRHFGVKAQPFVEPTAKEMETVMPRRLDLAVRRVLARRPDDGGGALA